MLGYRCPDGGGEEEENRAKCNEIGTKAHNLQSVYKDVHSASLMKNIFIHAI